MNWNNNKINVKYKFEGKKYSEVHYAMKYRMILLIMVSILMFSNSFMLLGFCIKQKYTDIVTF